MIPAWLRKLFGRASDAESSRPVRRRDNLESIQTRGECPDCDSTSFEFGGDADFDLLAKCNGCLAVFGWYERGAAVVRVREPVDPLS